MCKIACNIINDLMPLYVEEMVSDETKKMVEEHMADCADCMHKYKEMKKEIDIPLDQKIAPMTIVKKKLNQKKVQTILLAVFFSMAVMITAFIYVTAPIYMDYDNHLIRFKQYEDGSILATISGDVDGYSIGTDTGDRSNIDITMWNSLWNQYIKKGQERSFIINKNTEGGFYHVRSIYYYGSTGNGTIKNEDQLIYGEDRYGSAGVVTLPRLVLSYYFVIALVITVIGVIVSVLNKKRLRIHKLFQTITMVSISYIISQLCVKGIQFSSYSLKKDLSGIMLLMIPIFFILVILCRLIWGSKTSKRYKVVQK